MTWDLLFVFSKAVATMTVTIKKNTDVQGSVEANKLKYQVKRDLSGNVQWTNCTSVGKPLALYFIPPVTRQTVGFNFVKIPKIMISAGGENPAYTGTAYGKLKLNAVTKVSGTVIVPSTTYYVSSTFTAATVTQTITGASPNTFTISVTLTGAGSTASSATIFVKTTPQRNDKYTVMK